MEKLKEIARKITPQWSIRVYHRVRDGIRNSSTFMTIRFKCDRLRYWFIEKRIRLFKKEKRINVVFLVVSKQAWKYEELYRLMSLNPQRYRLTILVCPIVNRGRENMLQQLAEAYQFYSDRYDNVLKAYDESTDKYIKLRSLHPDIVLHTNPYKGFVDDRYYINNVRNALTCYLTYGADVCSGAWCYALELHQRVWRQFISTIGDVEYVKKYCPWAVSNRVVTGYPMYEILTRGTDTPKEWKNPDPKYKRIIWAPHHTIEGNRGLLSLSTFLQYADFILALTEKYKDKCQFVFKPHPLLRYNLEHHPDWGKERSDAYYAKWETGENTNYVNGDYIDLFNSSDAMMHDCGSFLQEYLYTQKPVMYLSNALNEEEFNYMGVDMYNAYYKAFAEDDIVKFIEDVVIKGKDPMKTDRARVFDKYLLPPNGRTASENILFEIEKVIGK